VEFLRNSGICDEVEFEMEYMLKNPTTTKRPTSHRAKPWVKVTNQSNLNNSSSYNSAFYELKLLKYHLNRYNEHEANKINSESSSEDIFNFRTAKAICIKGKT
jgi:hypothetical protein